VFKKNQKEMGQWYFTRVQQPFGGTEFRVCVNYFPESEAKELNDSKETSTKKSSVYLPTTFFGKPEQNHIVLLEFTSSWHCTWRPFSYELKPERAH